MTAIRMFRRLPALLLAAVVPALMGCPPTEIQGVLLDDDLINKDLMLGLAYGSDSEFQDVFSVNRGLQYNLLSGTDDITNDGTGADEIRLSVGRWNQREFQGTIWEQAHEASWVGIIAYQKMQKTYNEEEFAESPLVARVLLNHGLSERIMGEMFCEMVYNYGIDGGFSIEGDAVYDPSKTVPRDSAFKRALVAYQRALPHAQTALDSGVVAPGADPLFDPLFLVRAIHGAMAQAYANLGDWTNAVLHAQQVPDNYVFYVHNGPNNERNQMNDEFWLDDDLTVWGTPVQALFSTDPRARFTRCGDWNGTPFSSTIRNNNVCAASRGEFRSESNQIPMWRADKYPTSTSDNEAITGTEMRLIRAEAALQPGAVDLVEFRNQINAARAVHGLGVIPVQTTAGALEYPNAQDDAWSIMDRERYLDLWLEGRRLWDLERWNHPFIDGNTANPNGIALIPRHQTNLVAKRHTCFPLPNTECTQNGALGGCPVLP